MRFTCQPPTFFFYLKMGKVDSSESSIVFIKKKLKRSSCPGDGHTERALQPLGLHRKSFVQFHAQDDSKSAPVFFPPSFAQGQLSSWLFIRYIYIRGALSPYIGNTSSTVSGLLIRDNIFFLKSLTVTKWKGYSV